MLRGPTQQQVCATLRPAPHLLRRWEPSCGWVRARWRGRAGGGQSGVLTSRPAAWQPRKDRNPCPGAGCLPGRPASLGYSGRAPRPPVAGLRAGRKPSRPSSTAPLLPPQHPAELSASCRLGGRPCQRRGRLPVRVGGGGRGRGLSPAASAAAAAALGARLAAPAPPAPLTRVRGGARCGAAWRGAAAGGGRGSVRAARGTAEPAPAGRPHPPPRSLGTWRLREPVRRGNAGSGCPAPPAARGSGWVRAGKPGGRPAEGGRRVGSDPGRCGARAEGERGAAGGCECGCRIAASAPRLRWRDRIAGTPAAGASGWGSARLCGRAGLFRFPAPGRRPPAPRPRFRLRSLRAGRAPRRSPGCTAQAGEEGVKAAAAGRWV